MLVHNLLELVLQDMEQLDGRFKTVCEFVFIPNYKRAPWKDLEWSRPFFGLFGAAAVIAAIVMARLSFEAYPEQGPWVTAWLFDLFLILFWAFGSLVARVALLIGVAHSKR